MPCQEKPITYTDRLLRIDTIQNWLERWYDTIIDNGNTSFVEEFRVMYKNTIDSVPTMERLDSKSTDELCNERNVPTRRRCQSVGRVVKMVGY